MQASCDPSVSMHPSDRCKRRWQLSEFILSSVWSEICNQIVCVKRKVNFYLRWKLCTSCFCLKAKQFKNFRHYLTVPDVLNDVPKYNTSVCVEIFSKSNSLPINFYSESEGTEYWRSKGKCNVKNSSELPRTHMHTHTHGKSKKEKTQRNWAQKELISNRKFRVE